MGPGTRTLVLIFLVKVKAGAVRMVVVVVVFVWVRRFSAPSPTSVLKGPCASHPMTRSMMKLTRVSVLMNVELRTKIANRWFRILGR